MTTKPSDDADTDGGGRTTTQASRASTIARTDKNALQAADPRCAAKPAAKQSQPSVDDVFGSARVQAATGVRNREAGVRVLAAAADVDPEVDASRDEGALLRVADRVAGMLEGIEPRDPIEGMMAAQLYALHKLAMRAASRAARERNLDALDRYVRQATRLSGAYVAHADALKRWRSGGTQRVVVERVDVHAGGQAVVGAVAQGGGRNDDG
jgi:hypothetical protein